MVAIFDIGKTNKKCFVFDEAYRIVFEKSTQLPETTDENGFPCEDLGVLIRWVLATCEEVRTDERFQIRAIHCTTYGASLVHVDASGRPITPLYNYLKPFPEALLQSFLDQYGQEADISLETASPLMGHLNAGLQLFWLKHQYPLIFEHIQHTLHLPQFIAACFHGRYWSEMTSIGCHTMLWDFQKKDYHEWVISAGLVDKLPPVQGSNTIFKASDFLQILASKRHSQPTFELVAGVGLHDSSAALIPYLACFDEPFVLISTGTWCITLNPFNQEPLTTAELAQDCLCYLSYEGLPVKAARYFGGHEHALQVTELANEFGVPEDFYQSDQYVDHTELWDRYRVFMAQLMEKQAASTRLALGNTSVQRIFVDGGFANNSLYLNLLAQAFPEKEIFVSEIAQATALGAAIAIHPHWNDRPLPSNLISLKKQPNVRL